MNLVAQGIQKISGAEGFCGLDFSFCGLGNDLARRFVPNAKIASFLSGLLLHRIPKIFGFVSVSPTVDLLLDDISQLRVITIILYKSFGEIMNHGSHWKKWLIEKAEFRLHRRAKKKAVKIKIHKNI